MKIKSLIPVARALLSWTLHQRNAFSLFLKIKTLALTICMLAIALGLQAQGQLWGTTKRGGSNGGGVIFKTNADSSHYYSLVKDWILDTPGTTPQGTLLLASNGKYYGVTSKGGAWDGGVLFEYDPTNDGYVDRHDFVTTGSYNPLGGLVELNGKLYGTTFYSGAPNYVGVLYEFDFSTGAYVEKFSFNNAGGVYPRGSLITSNNKVYGIAGSGGPGGYGVLFEYTPAPNSYINKIEFDNTTTGGYPYTAPILAANGKLYGTTSTGGANNVGVLYEYDLTSSTFTKKFDFAVATGSKPTGSLVQASNGKLYGMTSEGATNNFGVIFEFDLSNSQYAMKVDLSGSGIGIRGFGGLAAASNGKLYGAISAWTSPSPDGVIIEFDPATGSAVKKQQLTFKNGAGSYAFGSLTPGSSNTFYGVFPSGGETGNGVIFRYDPVNDFYIKHIDFNTGSAGAFPAAGVTLASNGKLYGMTSSGGASKCGILYEVDPATGTYTKKIDLTYSNGANPLGGLMLAPNGKLYGTTTFGGASISSDIYYYLDDKADNQLITSTGLGALFQYDPTTNTYTKVGDFDGTNGANPFGNLITASNGKFYGTTSSGGANNRGTVFEYDPAGGGIVKRADLPSSSANGYLIKGPRGGLVEAPNGKLYGLTVNGGTNNSGSLFSFDPTSGALVVKFSFSVQGDVSSSSTGTIPLGALTLGADGKLYGLNSQDGNGGTAYTGGVLFQYDPVTDVYTTMKVLSTSTGILPRGDLKQDASGKFYFTANNGPSIPGSIVQYDPVSNTSVAKVLFNSQNGASPGYGPLALVSAKMEQKLFFGPIANAVFGGANIILTAKASSGLAPTYASSNTSVATVSGNVVTIVGAGSTTITASQVGNNNYNAATDISQSLTITKASQVINFPGNNLINIKTYGDAPFDLGVTASSGLPISYSSTNTSVATVSGTTITIVGAGEAAIYAHQVGNENYNAATDVYQNLSVHKADQTITFNTLPTKKVKDASFTLNASSTSGLTISYTSSDNTVATVSGNSVTIVGRGFTTINAYQNGNSNYWDALPTNQTLAVINTPPVVAKTIADQQATQRSSFSFTFDAGTFADDDNDSFTYSAKMTNGSALPSWLGFAASTRTFSGTPSFSDNNLSIQLTADDGHGGTVSTNFAINIQVVTEVTYADEIWSVYPNPVSKNLVVENKMASNDVMFTVFTTTGKIILQKICSCAHEEIDASDWAAGLYIVQMQSGSQRFQSKIAKY